jgi:hypothetical protein
MPARDRSMVNGAGKGLVAGAVDVAAMTLGAKAKQALTHRPNSFVPAHTLEGLLGAALQARCATARIQPSHAQAEHYLGRAVLLSWIGQLVAQWFAWANDQQEHNQPLEVGDFLWQFWTSSPDNWQSEFLQLLAFVVLTTFLIHRNSHESRDATTRCRCRSTGSRSGSRPWRARATRPRQAAADLEVPSWRTPPPRS